MKLKDIKISRKYVRKVNVGNFENIDFIAGAEAMCEEKDMEEVSKFLDNFVRREVSEDVKLLKIAGHNIPENLGDIKVANTKE